MTGIFELFTDSDASCRYRLTGPDGTTASLTTGQSGSIGRKRQNR